jgi:YVTN family beta-propeller protein
MPRFSRFAVLLVSAGLAFAPLGGSHAASNSRVIVSSTLNHGLLVLDAQTLEFTQPLLPSRGTSPVRMDVHKFGTRNFLFTANHGIAGSMGVFDLSGDLVLETPASPYPTGGFGSVGIDVSKHGVVAVTNTWFALGGCSMPNGSVTVFDTETTNGVMAALVRRPLDVQAAIPYAVAIDDDDDSLFVATNCGDAVEVFDPTWVQAGPTRARIGHERTATVPVGDGPDATLYDQERDLVYVVNIGGDSLSVIDSDTRTVVTTVAMPNSGPIDAALATSASGADWVLTGNGQDDTFSILDRDVLAACGAAMQATCPEALVARIDAGVDGGAPEGITHDPVTNRVFVVNKSPLMGPSLSAIQLTEGPEGVTGSVVGVVPLPAADPALPVPAIIAFDAVVDVRS